MSSNNIRQKLKSFNRVVSNTHLKDAQDIRTIYDEAIQIQFSNQPPTEMREEDIQRYMVNQIRHRCTNYNKQVRLINRIDSRIYSRYKNMVLNMIAAEYPFLANECQRQKRNTCIAICTQEGVQ